MIAKTARNRAPGTACLAPYCFVDEDAVIGENRGAAQLCDDLSRGADWDQLFLRMPMRLVAGVSAALENRVILQKRRDHWRRRFGLRGKKSDGTWYKMAQSGTRPCWKMTLEVQANGPAWTAQTRGRDADSGAGRRLTTWCSSGMHRKWVEIRCCAGR